MTDSPRSIVTLARAREGANGVAEASCLNSSEDRICVTGYGETQIEALIAMGENLALLYWNEIQAYDRLLDKYKPIEDLLRGLTQSKLQVPVDLSEEKRDD